MSQLRRSEYRIKLVILANLVPYSQLSTTCICFKTLRAGPAEGQYPDKKYFKEQVRHVDDETPTTQTE